MKIEIMERKRNNVFKRKQRKRDKIMKRMKKEAKHFEDRAIKSFIKAYSRGYNAIDLSNIKGYDAWLEIEQYGLLKLVNKLNSLYQNFDFNYELSIMRFKKRLD